MESMWFHGTQADFDNFSDQSRSRGTTDLISYLGHHFSEQPTTADSFALGQYGDENKSGRVIKARLNINNPKQYHFESDLREDIAQWQKASEVKGNKAKIAKGFVDYLRKMGHDGITYGNVIEGSYGNRCAIVFNAGQIEIV